NDNLGCGIERLTVEKRADGSSDITLECFIARRLTLARDITPSKGLNLSPSDGMEVEAKSPLRAILHSWKEIASELNRGVRTVQRWEQQLNMPVRRVSQGPRSPVFAFPAELHRWLRRKGAGMHSTGTFEGPRDAGLNAETRIKPNAELLRAIVNLFTMRSSR